MFVVGDPRQTIYQWRGSDERCFVDFKETYPEVETVNISENRRSAKNILDIANDFSDTYESGNYERLTYTRKEEGIISIANLENAKDEAIWLANQIENYIVNENCDYSDIGILYRSVTTSAPPLIDEMKRRGIPYIIGGKVGLFRREETKAVALLFLWLYKNGFWIPDPYNWRLRITENELLTEGIRFWREIFPHPLPDDLDEQLRNWKKDFQENRFKNFIEIFHALLNILRFKRLDPFIPIEAVIMANLGRFSSLLMDFEVATMIGGRKRNWKRDIRSFCWFINSYANTAYEEPVSDDIVGINAVQISTVHQAKGLEWGIVFIPSLIERRFPSSMAGKERPWMIPRTMFNAVKYEGSIEDERKVFYVAITRAKDIINLSYFNRISRTTNPSVFIESINHENLIRLTICDILPDYKIEKIIDLEDIQTFFTGEILTYQKCPYFYRLRELWGYKPELVPMLGYGNTLHYCLRNTSELMQSEGFDPISAAVTSVDRNFYLPFAEKAAFENAKNAVKEILVQFVQKNEQDMNRIKEVESRLEFPIQRAIITGKVDVILHDEGNLEVRDYKTSDEVTSLEESSLQVQLYSLGLKMIEQPVCKGSLAYLDSGEIKNVEVNEEKLLKAKSLAENQINNITEKKFEPKAGEFCQKCDFNIICRWCKINDSQI